MTFFPDSFYPDLGLRLAAVAAHLEAYFARQASVFADLECLVTGSSRSQYHIALRLENGDSVKVMTFPQSHPVSNNPDVQFGAVEQAFPSLNINDYRKQVLNRLGDLVTDEAVTDHRYVKFSYDLIQDPTRRARALAAFDWILTQMRIAAAR